jgi:hypothetical protein
MLGAGRVTTAACQIDGFILADRQVGLKTSRCLFGAVAVRCVTAAFVFVFSCWI